MEELTEELLNSKGIAVESIDPGYLRINDLEFYLPPLSINIQEHAINYKYDALRKIQPLKIKSGRSILQYTIVIPFTKADFRAAGATTNQESYEQLTKLIYQLRRCPFVSIENDEIRRASSAMPGEQMAGVINSVLIQTGAPLNMPELILATLSIQHFNYKPFSHNFTYVNKFDTNFLALQKSMYEMDSVNFSDSIKPYSPGTLYNSAAVGFLVKPHTRNIKIEDLDEYGVILGTKATPFEEYMYGNGRIREILGHTIGALTNDIKIQFISWAYPQTAMPEPSKISISSPSKQQAPQKTPEQIIAATLSDGTTIDTVDSNYVAWQSQVDPRLSTKILHNFNELAKRFSGEFNGKKLRLTSCFRTYAQQKALYEESLRTGKTGLAAKQDTSDHEKGVAFDIATQHKLYYRNRASSEIGDYVNGAKITSSERNEAASMEEELKMGLNILRPDMQYIAKDEQGLNAKEWKRFVELAPLYGFRPWSPTAVYGSFESWHFSWNKDFSGSLPGDERKASGNKLPATLNPMNLDSDYNKQVEEWKIKEAQKLGTGWQEVRIDETKRVLFKRLEEIVIREDDEELIPQSISVSFSHNLATMPILGWRYPTHQFLGPQDMAGSIQLIAVGAGGMTRLQQLIDIFHSQQDSAIVNRTVASKSPLYIYNPVLQAIGLNKVVLDTIEQKTIEGQPEARLAVLTFSEHDPEFETQTAEYSYLTNDFHIQKKIFEQLIEGGTIRAGFSYIGAAEHNIKNFAGIRFTRTTYYGNKMIDGLIQDLAEQLNNLSIIDERDRYGILDKIIFQDDTPKGLKSSLDTFKGKTLKEVILAFKTIEIEGTSKENITLRGDTPTQQFIAGNRMQLALPDQTDGKDIVRNIEGVLFGAGASLDDTLNIWYQARALPALYRTTDPSIKATMKQYDGLGKLIGRPAYPDLDLPKNPITGRVHDTNPDFFFYNESDTYVMGTLSQKWDFWIDRASEFMETSYNNLRTQIFRENEGYFFYGDEYQAINPAYLDLAPMEGIESQKGNPVIRDKERDTEKVISYSGEVKRIEDRLNQSGKNPFLKNVPVKFTNSVGREDYRNWIDFIKTYLTNKTGIQRDIVLDKNLLDKNGNVIKAPDAKEPLIHEFSAKHFQKLLKTDFKRQFYHDKMTMRRAYPTFKIYFIDEDTPDSMVGTRFTDDFYDMNAINSITIVRSRKIAADLAVIEILNTDGRFTRKLYEGGWITSNKIPEPITEEGTPQENDLKNIAVKDGTKVQIRLGYMNDPEQLDIVFNGQIVGLEGSDVITMVCQSYATELVSHPKGLNENKSWWGHADTDEILSYYITSPECKHFGRYTPIPRLSIADPIAGTFTYQKLRPDGRAKKIWSLTVDTEDDNIFVQPLEAYCNVYWGYLRGVMTRTLSIPFNLVWYPIKWATKWNNPISEFTNQMAANSWLSYRPNNLTIWEIFKEMELRHPGWYASVVPYGDRMTMFFGVPAQRYFFRDPRSYKEQKITALVARWRELSSIAIKGPSETWYGLGLIHTDKAKEAETISQLMQAREELSSYLNKTVSSPEEMIEAALSYRVKTFRDYHLVTSEHDIISNNIRADYNDVPNRIRVYYSSDVKDQSARKLADDLTPDSDNYAVVLDPNIPEEHIREKVVVEPNCNSEDMARRYGVGHLLRESKDYYKGELVILGNPKIKPMDTVWCIDTYNEIIGPVDVEKVVHFFSKNTGFITEITPDLCVHANESACLLTIDAIGQVLSLGHTYTGAIYKAKVLTHGKFWGTAEMAGDVLKVGAGTAAGGFVAAGVLTPVVMFGGLALSIYGGLKLLRSAVGRFPIIATPLLRQGKPYISGMQYSEIDGLVSHINGEWNKFQKDFEHGMRFVRRGMYSIELGWWANEVQLP